MSKRNRNRFREREHSSPSSAPVKTFGQDASIHHAEEYKIITRDMIRLVALNGFMLAAVIVVYYTNRTSGYLERFFERFF